MTESASPALTRNVIFLVLVASLGYFVDIYDLLVFSIVRMPSLLAIGVKPADVKAVGITIIDWQMGGLLIGGLLWGIMGDKLGRIKVLFGSILLYSIANFVNGRVTSIDQYIIVRFIAGVGLAGELGAGITLVTETMKTTKRGYGTMIVSVIGLLGAAAAVYPNLLLSTTDASLNITVFNSHSGEHALRVRVVRVVGRQIELAAQGAHQMLLPGIAIAS